MLPPGLVIADYRFVVIAKDRSVRDCLDIEGQSWADVELLVHGAWNRQDALPRSECLAGASCDSSMRSMILDGLDWRRQMNRVNANKLRQFLRDGLSAYNSYVSYRSVISWLVPTYHLGIADTVHQ